MQMVISEERFLVERHKYRYKMQHCRNGKILSSIDPRYHYKLPLSFIGLLA